MKKILSLIILLSFFMDQGFAQNFYTVIKGDILSRIVKKKFPRQKLYGQSGKIAEVLEHNPNIKNPNLIYPNQKIYLEPYSAIKEETSVSEEKGREMNKKTSERWSLAALYGVKFLSASQSGDLGKADVGELFFHDLILNSEFLFNDLSLGIQLESYKFKNKKLKQSDSRQMYSAKFYGTYKWILGGVSFEDVPLFKSQNGNADMTKVTILSLDFGAKKDFKLEAKKPTILKLKGWLNYPLSSTSSSSKAKLESIQGIGVTGQADFNKEFYRTQVYSLHGIWMTQLGFQNISQKVDWDASRGKVKSNFINASTAVGVLFKF